jgi:5' nucleotidase family
MSTVRPPVATAHAAHRITAFRCDIATWEGAVSRMVVLPPAHGSGSVARAVLGSNAASCARRGMLALRSSSAPTATAPHTGLRSLAQAGIPVEGLRFDPRMVERGLVIDTLRGSLLKVDRFGLVKRAMHGARMLSPAEIRREYGRGQVRVRMLGLTETNKLTAHVFV